MKKNLKHLLLSSLLFLGVTVPLTSCGNNGAVESSENSNHIISASETSEYIVYKGQTAYKIVVPREMSSEIQYAKDELTRMFYEATGITLETVSDSSIGSNSDDRLISLGENSYFASSGISIDKSALKRDGIRILTRGRSIFVVGGSDIGTLYGVYDLLAELFNFEAYTPDCHYVDTGITDLKLKNYDITDIPDIEYRMRRGIMNPSTQENDDTMFAYRMRHLDGYGKKFLPIHLTDSKTSSYKVDHNSFYYFPQDQYLESHSKFYSNDVTQLCFTAHGDNEEFELMTDIAARKIEQSLAWYPAAQYPDYIGVEFGMNDTPYLCDCTACTAFSAEHNGAISSTIIHFLQRLGEKVNAWMDEAGHEAYKRDLQYMFLAYQAASKPPIKKLDDGSFEYKESILPHNGVKIVPFVASMGLDYGKAFYSSANDEGREYIETWGRFFEGSWAWSYGGFFNDYFSFFDLYSFYNDYHAFLNKYHYAFTFQQCHDDQKGADPGFFTLASYILAKKAWNSSLSVGELMDDYFAKVYLEAEKPMRDMFQRLRLWFAQQTVEKGWGGSILSMSVSANKKFWSIGLVKELLGYIDEAYGKIEIYKKNASLYNKLCNRIDTEWLFPAKIVIDCYEDEFSASEYAAIKTRFKTVCRSLSIKDIREFVSINSYLESL